MWMLVAEYKALNAKNVRMTNSLWLMRNPYEASTLTARLMLCYAHGPRDQWGYNFQDSLDNTAKARQTEIEKHLFSTNSEF